MITKLFGFHFDETVVRSEKVDRHSIEEWRPDSELAPVVVEPDGSEIFHVSQFASAVAAVYDRRFYSLGHKANRLLAALINPAVINRRYSGLSTLEKCSTQWRNDQIQRVWFPVRRNLFRFGSPKISEACAAICS